MEPIRLPRRLTQIGGYPYLHLPISVLRDAEIDKDKPIQPPEFFKERARNGRRRLHIIIEQ
jgi:hypothetical protein